MIEANLPFAFSKRSISNVESVKELLYSDGLIGVVTSQCNNVLEIVVFQVISNIQ
jgi:hypothetical protein